MTQKLSAVAVVAAMKEELAPLRARLDDVVSYQLAGRQVATGKIAGQTVVTMVCGVGAVRARRGLKRLLERIDASELFIVGVAGGLSSQLRQSELVVGDHVVWADGDEGEVFRANHQRTKDVVIATGALRGTCVTVGKIVCSVSQKRAIKETYAPDGAATVDMETAAQVQLAEKYGIPWVALRAVSDTAEEALPAFFDKCHTSDGAIDRARITREALIRPTSWRQLTKMRESVTSCAERLADAVVETVRASR